MNEEDEKTGRTIGDALYELVQWAGLVTIILIIAKCHMGAI